ncbi:MAG: ABC transporter permease [Deltaproteobacteria bacterium]|nr:ABC transporter permease [Deltaproteobacteria bacterium]
MLRDLLADALRDVRANWLRVLLTGSGIVWGIALFVTLSASGTAMRAHYRAKMEAIGRKVIFTFPGAVARQGSANRNARRITLEVDDPPRLTASPLVERAAPELWNGARVMKGGGHIKVVWTYGVGPETGRIRNFQVGRGRFINAADVAERRRVLVIGAKVAERLFGRQSALGRQVRLEGHPFRIVGVSVAKGEQFVNMGPRDDEQALLPVTTAQALFSGSDAISHIIYEPRTREEGAASIGRARALLSRHHHFKPQDEEAVSFFNIVEAMRRVELIGVALQVFLVACGVLTLVVGGVGVMNIMLVAVAERTRDLAVCKAVGASRRDLFMQVIAETVIITVGAGLAGLALGSGIILILQVLRNSAERAQLLMPEVSFSPALALLSFAVLVGVGILAGIVPALRAARLDPAVALREE